MESKKRSLSGNPTNETGWQYTQHSFCPVGCPRDADVSSKIASTRPGSLHSAAHQIVFPSLVVWRNLLH